MSGPMSGPMYATTARFESLHRAIGRRSPDFRSRLVENRIQRITNWGQVTPMTNADVAGAFEQVADLMEIKGEDGFRVNSYRRVARTIEDLPGQIADVAARGELATLAGIGKASAEKIQELLTTGRMKLRDELLAEVPESLLKLLEIPGVGPKKVSLLWKERGVTSLDDLKQAIAGGKLDGLKGFGAKSIEGIRSGIEFLAKSSGRTRLGVAWDVAEHFRAAVAGFPGAARVECAGSLRRGVETIGDIDLLCTAASEKVGGAIIQNFTKLPGVAKVLAQGETKGSALVEYAPEKFVQVDLRVVPAASFGAAWLYFTGSKEHNIRLRERAGKRGWTLNEYSLSEEKTGRVIAAETEESIYAALGSAWVPPELREDRGELDVKAFATDLLTLDMIRGDLHMHTTASDGRSSIEEMIAGARARGYEYICITDHSQSSVIANGLKPERLRKHIAQVRKIARKMTDIRVMVGAEVDILGAGELDYDDELLAELDWVVASVHSGQGKDIDRNTARTLAAIRHRYVNLIAHPTGRLLGKRDAMPLDLDTVAREAAQTGTALEINASHFRLDLRDQHARRAAELGATLCIDCDAHGVEQFDQMRFGVTTARRAGLRRDNVLNTRNADAIAAFVKRKRDRANPRT